jgi:Lsr2 protein
MAQQTVTVCDVDSRTDAIVPAAAHVRLDLDGDMQEYDLCKRHLDELRDALGGLFPLQTSTRRSGQRRARKASKPTAPTSRGKREGGRRETQTTGPRTSTSRRAPAARRQTAPPTVAIEEVRRWAREHRLEVKDRGRIPNAVIEQYRASRKASASPQD